MSKDRTINKKRSKRLMQGDVPVAVVSRSNKNIQVQLFDPSTRKTLLTVSSNTLSDGTKTDKSVKVGEEFAKKLQSMKIDTIVFNRNGFIYQGRIKALADSMRAHNIQF